MSASAGRAISINIVGNIQQLTSSLNQAQHHITSFQDKMKMVAKTIAAVGFATALTLGKKAITIASDTNEALSKTQTVFGKSSAAVEAFAASSAKGYGTSKRAALDLVSAMGSILVAQGQSQDAASKTSLEYTKLAADLGSFNNTSTEEAAQALTASLTGEYDQLKKYGIVINDVRLAQEAQREGMKKAGATWSTEQKAILSHNIILHDTKQATGDFARTSSGLANSQKILSATLDDVQGKFGAKLLPAMIKVTQAGVKLIDWSEKHATLLKIVAVAVIGFTVAIGLWSAATTIAAFATGGWATSFWALNAALFANPVGLVVVAVAGLAAGLVIAYKKSEKFREVVNAVFDGLRTVVITAIKAMFNLIVGFWEMIITGAAKAFGWVPGLGDKLKSAAKAIGEFRDKANTFLDGIKDKDINVNIRVHGKLPGDLSSGGGTNLGGGQMRATGGPVTPGSGYIVGERGPEWFQPSVSGHIIPNGRLGGGGSGAINLTINQYDEKGSLKKTIREIVRVDGGGNAQKAFGK